MPEKGLIEAASDALSSVGAKIWGTPTNNPVLVKESLADELFDRSTMAGVGVTNPKLLPRHQREAMQARVDALVQWMEDPKTKEQYEGFNPESILVDFPEEPQPILVDQPLEPQPVKKEKRDTPLPCAVKYLGGCQQRDWFVVSEPFVTEEEGGPQYLYDNARGGYNNPPSAAGAYPDPSHGGEITFGFEISADYLKEHASLDNPKSVLNLIKPFSDKHNELIDYCNGDPVDRSCPPKTTELPTTPEENEEVNNNDGYTTTQKIGMGVAAGLGAFGVSLLAVGVAGATYKNCKKPSKEKDKDIEFAETKPEIDIVPLEKPKDLVITNIHAEGVVVV